MPSVPSDLSLDLAIGPQIASAEHINNYTAIQTAVNGILDILDGGTTGNLLQVGGSGPDWTGLPFTSYVPTWSSTGTAPSLGNGSLDGRYLQVGDLVMARIRLLFGSTTTAGTGIYSFSLPLAADVSSQPVGSSFATDAGVNIYTGIAVLNSSTTFAAFSPASPSVQWGATVPFSFANGDNLDLIAVYEAA